ncbi:isochorismatase family protein [Serratia sp. JSRIV001]|uniref:isochorismatase family protein n=1 Tax=unclassified Serratia (in: enterobacteria) TaxID=2647522 RepID=UPI001CBD6B92|nr:MULTISPECIES: isochorismatase family protein [unclassified Serratia (in: enterobacteria)]UAN43925.1 isochorismatase family protein [Serratia sp. JSRIV001]UAN53563.1 isochorismatase family protein [Serratia sp. JSRIV002]UAN58184.1 isochorismatase family protein [Serratia sp. JSRIV004]
MTTTFTRFTGDNAAMLLIDHQIGTMGWVKSIHFNVMKQNALLLANAASILKMPTVLTSSMEDNVQGPLLSELANILPDSFKARIKRLGVVNAMDDVNFATAVETTGRKRLIIAGVTNDVCTVYPALSLVNAGFEVQVVADAGGSPSAIADDIALRRMERAGVTLTTTNQLLAELAGDWSTPEGTQLVELLVGTLQSPAK